MSDDPQKLNSLERFRKRSDHLVLEQYSACEVPAGCGGVVLRWRDPHQTRPANVYVYSQVSGEWYLDGVRFSNGLVDLAPGDHILAIHFESMDLELPLIAFAAVARSDGKASVHARRILEPEFVVLSAADGTWRFTLQQPDENAWTRADFADHEWQALTAKSIPKYDWNSPGAYAIDQAKRLGATFLGAALERLPEGKASWLNWLREMTRHQPRVAPPSHVWIRKVFAVPRPVESPSDSGAP